MLLLCARLVTILPRITVEPKNTMVVRLQMPDPGSSTQIRIRSANTSGTDIYFSNGFHEYVPKHYQIARMTMYVYPKELYDTGQYGVYYCVRRLYYAAL